MTFAGCELLKTYYLRYVKLSFKPFTTPWEQCHLDLRISGAILMDLLYLTPPNSMFSPRNFWSSLWTEPAFSERTVPHQSAASGQMITGLLKPTAQRIMVNCSAVDQCYDNSLWAYIKCTESTYGAIFTITSTVFGNDNNTLSSVFPDSSYLYLRSASIMSNQIWSRCSVYTQVFKNPSSHNAFCWTARQCLAWACRIHLTLHSLHG